jgi:LDH2 family malate/lactate/ureidoglycolate dehydrogenase
MIPGDPSRRTEQLRRREGIPLIPAVVEALERVARQTGVPLG